MRRFTDFTRAKDNKISKTGFMNKDVASSLSTYESLSLLQRFLWIPEATLPLNKYSNGTGIIENVANFQYQGSAKSELY